MGFKKGRWSHCHSGITEDIEKGIEESRVGAERLVKEIMKQSKRSSRMDCTNSIKKEKIKWVN